MSQEEEEVECVDAECCHMCFSTERKLTSLDGVVDIYLLIVGLSADCEESVKELRSCWECRAMLQRILKFRRQAQWAHNVFVTADALLLDSDMCMSKLKFNGINKINLKRKLELDTVRDVLVDIAPKDMENVHKHPFSDHTKSSSDRNSMHGVFVQQDNNEQHIEANASANNMYQLKEKEFVYSMNTPVDVDPLAMEIKEEDDFDEGDIFHTEPACDQDQTDINEQAIRKIKTNVTKSNNLISNIKTVEKNDLSQNYTKHSSVKPFITSTMLNNPSEGLTKTKQLMVVIDPLNFSKYNLTPRGEKVTKFNFEDNLDNSVIAPQPSERKANSKNINVVESLKSQLNIHNINLDKNVIATKPLETKYAQTNSKNINMVESMKPQLKIHNINDKHVIATKPPETKYEKTNSKNINMVESVKPQLKIHNINLDKDIIATKPPETKYAKTNSKNINMVESMHSLLKMHNTHSTSLQPVSIKQLDKIQSNLMTVKISKNFAIGNIKTYERKSKNVKISNIKTFEKDDLPEYHSNHSPVKPFISSTVLDNPSDGLTKTKQIIVVTDAENISKTDFTLREEEVTLFKDLIATQPPNCEYTKANSKNINIIESVKPQLNIHNIPSTSLQSVNIKQLDKIQSNLMTVKNISPLQDESQRLVLHHTIAAQHSQIDSTFVKTTPLTERVLSNDVTAQYNVKGNLKHTALTPRELKIVKPDENIKPVMNRTRKNLPENMKKLHETFRRGASKPKLAKIRVTKVTKSELNDFLVQARNNETYLTSPFKCEICILGFKEECFLRRHMIRYRHATISKSEFVCDVCLSSLPSEQELNTHQSIHDSLYSCTREDFTSVLPLNVYHHFFEKHTFNKKCKTSLDCRPQVNLIIKQSRNYPTWTSAKKYKRKVKEIESKKYEVFKPNKDDFEFMRIRVSLMSMRLPNCEDCCQRFYSNEKLEEHRYAHSESAGAHVCDMCKLRFTTAELLIEHRPVHDKWYKCKADPACLHVAQKLSTIQRHIYSKHSTSRMKKIGIRPHVSHECNICKKVFKSATSLKIHMQIHNKRHMCEVCGYITSNTSNLAKHKQRQHTTGSSLACLRPHVSHECNICKKVFMTTQSLYTHMLIHNKRHMCEVCGHITSTAFALAKHKQRQHTTGERDYLVCEFCPKRFISKIGLKYHRSRHLQVKSYACKLCDEKFYSPNLRSRHVGRVHEKKQNIESNSHKCTLCREDFTSRWMLLAHRRNHEKIHKCDKCPKSFTWFNQLVSHQESHTYICECDICGKVFANRDTLTYHLHSKHSGGTETQRVKREKLKECSECGKVFQSVKKWEDHMKTHLIFPEDIPELS